VAGFIRRYGFSPGIETITLIEGVVIVDLPPPGAVSGVSTGVVGLVGEFADMTYATAVDSTGAVTTKVTPVEILSGADLLDKVGGFDSTLGDEGGDGGNGYVALRNKKFSRLVVAPVNLASAGAGRAWRQLPTNRSLTSATPVVPMAGGRVEAGREFRNSTNRVKLGKRINFTALGHYKNGVDGAVTAAGAPAATQTFNSAGSTFLTSYNGGVVPKGHILVLGVIDGAGALGANAGTYRVTADAASNTALVVEKLDGTTFDWTSGTLQPFRIHPGSDADSAIASAKLSDTAGYTLPCRPIDALIAAAALCTPTVVPAANAVTSWDPLSGLYLRSHVSSGFAYSADLQGANTAGGVSGTGLDAAYATAMDSLLQDTAPARDVNIVFGARTTTVIRAGWKTHVGLASQNGLGRVACISPDLATTTGSTACGDTTPGVGATRSESVFYSWPGVQTFVPEASGVTMGTADGLTTSDGVLDVRGDGFLAAVLSNLPPELNPGQAGEPITTVLSPVLGIQRGITSLQMGDYINMKAAGICGMRMDRTAGPIFQSGVTSSLTSGQKNISRRRMANFIQDSVSQRLVQFAKKPTTTANKDSAVAEVDAFLAGLLSTNNPPAQRISGYLVDDKSGNTPNLEAQGVFVIIGKVRTLASMDEIVFQTEIGEGVVLTTTA